MYKNILIPLENSPTDQTILEHIRSWGKTQGVQLTLIHVADGFVARNQDRFNLVDSEEMIRDREYLEKIRADFVKDGYQVVALLERGDPTTEILRVSQERHCDLIAMSTHGHLFWRDFIFGTVATNVRHRTEIPVLLLKAPHSNR